MHLRGARGVSEQKKKKVVGGLGIIIPIGGGLTSSVAFVYTYTVIKAVFNILIALQIDIC